MKTTITQEDLEKAQKEYAERGSIFIDCCCLVFQACKRVGIPIRNCGIQRIIVSGGSEVELHFSCHKITEATPKDWPSFVGTEIELPDLK